MTSKQILIVPKVAELRVFLIMHGGYYLPPNSYLTRTFLKKVLSGEKKLIKFDDVR